MILIIYNTKGEEEVFPGLIWRSSAKWALPKERASGWAPSFPKKESTRRDPESLIAETSSRAPVTEARGRTREPAPTGPRTAGVESVVRPPDPAPNLFF